MVMSDIGPFVVTRQAEGIADAVRGAEVEGGKVDGDAPFSRQ